MSYTDGVDFPMDFDLPYFAGFCSDTSGIVGSSYQFI